MFAICIEASHKRGMGHLFRALNLISYLEEKKEPYLVAVNDDEASIRILQEKGIPFEPVDFSDESSDWETALIGKYGITVWLNDKFESSYALCMHVAKNRIAFAVIDERGRGAELADIHFAGMMFGREAERLLGKRVLTGAAYNILNPEIARYKRLRKNLGRIVVTLGGSDTYGATVPVVRLLKKYGYAADIITGANFRHERELRETVDQNYRVFPTVPSLAEAFSHYDLAVTGGGVTPFEANAAGLPCVIVANEPHEIATAKYLEGLGGAVFAGYYSQLDESRFQLDRLDIAQMSKCAAQKLSLHGRETVYRELKELERVKEGAK